jgi:hypothetical protein
MSAGHGCLYGPVIGVPLERAGKANVPLLAGATSRKYD